MEEDDHEEKNHKKQEWKRETYMNKRRKETQERKKLDGERDTASLYEGLKVRL